MWRGRAAGGLVLLGLWSCAERLPVLERVDPPQGPFDRANAVVLRGRDFWVGAAETRTEMSALPWEGEVGGRPLERVHWVSPDRIEAVVPLGLEPGVYDVILRSGERRTSLMGAYTSFVPVAPRLDSAEPSSIPLSGGPVRLAGAGLYAGTEVLLDDRVVAVQSFGDRAIGIVCPPRQDPGPAVLEVRTLAGRLVRTDLVVYALSD